MTFATTLFNALHAADIIHLDDKNVDRLSLDDETAIMTIFVPIVLFSMEMEDEFQCKDQPVVVDDHGLFTASSTDDKRLSFKVTMTRPLAETDIDKLFSQQ